MLHPKRLEWTSPGSIACRGDSNSPTIRSAHQGYDSTISPLDQRAIGHTENLQVVGVQVDSAKQLLEEKRNAVENMLNQGRRKKTCGNCHLTGHNKSRCTGNPCVDVNICQRPDKHPHVQNEIRELQK